MVSPELRTKIEEAARIHGLDPDLVHAFVLTESSGNPRATRYEPAFYRRYIAPHISKYTESEAKGRATSFGLMQIMGQVAREIGYKGTFEDLLKSEMGLDWGCKYLKRQLVKYAGDGAIAAYNAGSPRRTDTGKSFRNQAYVDKVLNYYKELKKVSK